jgi:putative chitinase
MSLSKLQEKLGLEPNGLFGPHTMQVAMEYYKMTPERAAHFFGQTCHETGNFARFEENLNYSTEGLLKTFKKYFTIETAPMYARNPQRIANKVYANRMGNGNEASGDGYKFKGRGALQLTGKANYKAFSDYLKNPEIVENPDLVAEEFSFESAIFFFDKNKLWNICDKGINKESILALTKKINGGVNGLDDREEKTFKYYTYVK